MGQGKKGDQEGRGTLELIGLESEKERPEIAIHALGKSGEVLASTDVGPKGDFSLPAGVTDKADKVVFAAKSESDPGRLGSEQSVAIWGHDLRERIAAGLPIEFERGEWLRLLLGKRCVSGSVTRCLPVLPIAEGLLADAWQHTFALDTELDIDLGPALVGGIKDAVLATLPSRRATKRPLRCEKVCKGEIQVFARTCCCPDLVIDDRRLTAIIDRLREVAVELPPIRWPERDPFPELELLDGGLLDEVKLNASRDLKQLTALGGREQLDYVTERPYLRSLWCTCGGGRQVATGQIRPDGTFHICWEQSGLLLERNCHQQYAFVVTQEQVEGKVTIYDGPKAGRWFLLPSGIELSSSDPRAQVCPPEVLPGELPYAMLTEIGTTDSYRLRTPDASGWNRVGAADFNHGLLDPEPDQAAAEGQERNRNLGGTLKLRFFFSPALQGLGAHYYRIAYAPANDAGEPTGAYKPLSEALAWKIAEDVGPSAPRAVTLGPEVKNGEQNLYEIPFPREGETWSPNQYHGYIETETEPDGRHLLRLEIFDIQGRRLAPEGSPNEVPARQEHFTYARWEDPERAPAEVHYAGLTHMLWWDNREANVEILALSIDDGPPENSQCQFLHGKDASELRVEYRAYHPTPLFIHHHHMWWRRGLNGATGELAFYNHNSGTAEPWIATTDPDATGTESSFLEMLTKAPQPGAPSEDHRKCSFAINLNAQVKTTDGISSHLVKFDDGTQAAFALERTPGQGQGGP